MGKSQRPRVAIIGGGFCGGLTAVNLARLSHRPVQITLINQHRPTGRGAAFGGVMDVGYLPDMFGHIAQMPQILRLAGFHDAVVWRGVPSQVKKNGCLVLSR